MTLHLGDCLEVMRTMPDASVDAVVTDPPYGLSFMGKRWDYDVPTTEVWAECLRVLKPGGHLLAFAGTRTQHRMAVRIEDAGFEIRDLILYCYGSGFPKSTDISRRIDLEEQKRWLDVSKALDNLEIAAIMEAWKGHSRAASTAGLSFAKSPTATGISTPKSGFAPEPVLLQANQESSDALALVAELSFKEAHLTSEAEINSAPMPAAASESQNPVKCAEHLRKRSSAISTRTGIVQGTVKELPSESMAGNLKAVEALKTWLGSKPSSMQAVTNALCVALTEDLKLITLNQSKTFQGFDTTRQTDCASAISVTITESMAECLILFTVDTLRKQAIDKAAGAEREVVGRHSTSIPNITPRPSDGDRFSNGDGSITAPATPEAQQWAGWGTALKPALEPITMARKPLDGTVAANVLAHGTGGLNVDGCRVGTTKEVPASISRKAQANCYGKYAEAGETPGVGGHDPNIGRWPANLIHDGSDEVVGLFPQTVAGGGFQQGMIQHSRTYNVAKGVEAERVRDAYERDNGGSAARFFKQCKGYTEAWPNLTPEPANTAGSSFSPQRRFVAFALSDAATWALPVGSCNSLSLAPSTSATANELRQLSESVITAIQSIAPKFWQESRPAKLTLTLNHASFAVTREQTGITTITASHWKSDGSAEPVTFNITGTNTEAGDQASAPRAFYTAKASRDDRSDGNTHPTVKPTDLMRYLCRLVTPPGGTVLDPFMGSGSTGKAAMLEGFEFIGIEREAQYFAIAEQRITRAAAAGYQPSLLESA